jgi:ribosome biogenesis GTPase
VNTFWEHQLIMIDFDFEALRLLGLNNLIVSRLAGISAPPGSHLVRLTEIQRAGMTVHDGDAEHAARIHPSLAAELAVGDWLLAERNALDELWIIEQISPATQIARRTSEGRRQLLASNIDTALLVMGLDQDFNLRRLERYIAIVTAADIAPVVVFTKCDLAARDIGHRLPAHIPLLHINGLDAASAAQLDPWLGAGQTVCLLGASGAGKSTLTNTLTGAQQPTGGVRKGDNRGRHTTTARSLHFCQTGACIIDTPGLRSWSPDADESSIAATFDDIESLSSGCQFRDCRHEAEPGCAVRGVVDPDRLQNYHKLLREVRRSQATPLDRIAERNRWKVLGKAAVARSREKRS